MSKHGFGKFAIGAGIGALIGILIAPKKGSETREELKVKYEEFLKKVKSLSKEDIQEEFQIKIEKVKKEIEELDKEKGTPVLEKTADDIRVKAIDVTKNVLEKLENADKKAKENKENK